MNAPTYQELYQKDPELTEKVLDLILPAIMPAFMESHGKEIMQAMSETSREIRQAEWDKKCKEAGFPDTSELMNAIGNLRP